MGRGVRGVRGWIYKAWHIGDIRIVIILERSFEQLFPFSRNKKICDQIWSSEIVMTFVITVEFNTSMRQAGSDYKSSNWLISGEISAAGCIGLTLTYQADKPAWCCWAADLRCQEENPWLPVWLSCLWFCLSVLNELEHCSPAVQCPPWGVDIFVVQLPTPSAPPSTPSYTPDLLTLARCQASYSSKQ